MLTVEQIARVCHEANRTYSEAADLELHKPWGHAPQWQRDSAIKGVENILANPWMSPIDSHESWYAEKASTGWRYGPTKDENAKTHPCMVPYLDLPETQRAKDTLFVNIVRALMPAPTHEQYLNKQGYADFNPSADVPVAQPVELRAKDAEDVLRDPEQLFGGDAGRQRAFVDLRRGVTTDGVFVGGVIGKAGDMGLPNQNQVQHAMQPGTNQSQQPNGGGSTDHLKENDDGEKSEGQPRSEPSQADRDGRQAPGGEGGGTTEAGEVKTPVPSETSPPTTKE